MAVDVDEREARAGHRLARHDQRVARLVLLDGDVLGQDGDRDPRERAGGQDAEQETGRAEAASRFAHGAGVHEASLRHFLCIVIRR